MNAADLHPGCVACDGCPTERTLAAAKRILCLDYRHDAEGLDADARERLLCCGK